MLFAENTPATIQEKISRLQKALCAKRPILGEVMVKHGQKTLHQYIQDFLDVNPSPVLDARKPELFAVIEDLLAARLGPEVAAGVRAQLTRLPLVSTADHHSPIQDPFWLNSDILLGMACRGSNLPAIRYIIGLAFASVSTNNATGYPRGIMFHGERDNLKSTVRIPILSDKMKMSVVYTAAPFGQAELDKAAAVIAKKTSDGEISPERAQGMRETLMSVFGSPGVLSAPDLATQITKINFVLWSKFFHCPQATPPAPQLVYLEIESVVREALLRHHVDNSQSLIHKVIFNPAYQQLLLELFNNLPGAFSLEHKWGTHLFWGLDDKGHRVELELADGKLRSGGRTIIVELTPESLGSALRAKKIYPGMLLCYLVVSLYYGLKCLGGFCQINDLTLAKRAWMELLRRRGELEASAAVEPVQTKELVADLVVAYLRDAQNRLVPATGLDLLLEKASTSFDSYIAFAQQFSLIEVMDPMLPEMYPVVYGAAEREAELSALTSEEIISGTGLKDRFISQLGL